MKRLLILALVLVCAPLWADGGWDLTKPANNGYVASFPAEVRANQAAIVASLTPPIEWTGTEADYGTPSVKLGYTATFAGEALPAFWLGSIGSGTFYGFGPRGSFSDVVSTTEWGVLVASYSAGDQYLQLLTPKGPGGVLGLYSAYFGIGDRRLASVATGTAAQDAVNLGQMNAAINSVQVIAQSHHNTPKSEILDVFSYVSYPGTLATFSFELVDTHSSWDGATFTAPVDGVYEVSVTMQGYSSAFEAVYTVLMTDNISGTYVASAPYFLGEESRDANKQFTLSGENYVPLSQGNTFCVFVQTVGANVFTVDRCSRIIYIRRIADLP